MTVALPAARGRIDVDTEPVETVVRPALPWAFGDLRRVARVVVTGGAGLFVSWVVASGTPDVEKQGYAIVGGVLAAAFALAGCAGWVVAGLHAVRTERARLLAGMADLLTTGADAQSDEVAPDGLVTAHGMTHAHRPTCLVARGKPLRSVRRTDRLAPCPMCLGYDTVRGAA